MFMNSNRLIEMIIAGLTLHKELLTELHPQSSGTFTGSSKVPCSHTRVGTLVAAVAEFLRIGGYGKTFCNVSDVFGRLWTFWMFSDVVERVGPFFIVLNVTAERGW